MKYANDEARKQSEKGAQYACVDDTTVFGWAIHYFEEDNRPQIALDRNIENGMAVSAGRLREDRVYDWKFVGMSHNTLRGAAGGAVLSAELLTAQGYIKAK